MRSEGEGVSVCQRRAQWREGEEEGRPHLVHAERGDAQVFVPADERVGLDLARVLGQRVGVLGVRRVLVVKREVVERREARELEAWAAGRGDDR